MLYQKFCFKVEELIVDYYRYYYPEDVKKVSRHAFFMRLRQ